MRIPNLTAILLAIYSRRTLPGYPPGKQYRIQVQLLLTHRLVSVLQVGDFL